MINSWTEKRRRSIAWILLLVFYAEMAGSAYAAKKQYVYQPRPYFNSTPTLFPAIGNEESKVPFIIAEKVEADGIATPLKVKEVASEAGPVSVLATDSKLSDEKESSLTKLAIGGPGQPETSTFKSVGADNMVNLFTGDFSYNIPLMDVDGYPINIFYDGGASMDQEASWVGLGWNLNPGSVNRNVRGIPDDFNGITNSVTKEQSIKPDITVGVNGSKDLETVGLPITASGSIGATYNNKRGVGLEIGVNGQFTANKQIAKKSRDEKTSKDTIAQLNVPTSGVQGGLTLNSQNGLTTSLSLQHNLYSKNNNLQLGLSTSTDFNSRTGLSDLRLSGELKYYSKYITSYISAPPGPFGSSISFARSSYTPSIRMPITNINGSFRMQVGREAWGNTKAFSIGGSVVTSSINANNKKQIKPAYGFMYAEMATDDKNALMDFNRLNDGSYTNKTPAISIPVYTYDVFTISGEGTGGSFRGYRGSMGHMRDNYTRSNSGSGNIALELSKGEKVKVGATVGGVYSGTTVGDWNNQNTLKQVAEFQKSEKLIQKGFYFKNPGERAIIDEDYYNALGQDNLMRPVLGNRGNVTPPFNVPIATLQSKFQLYNAKREETNIISVTNDNTFRHERDKRTQVISYLTAEEADKVGLDRYIYSYSGYYSFKAGGCVDDYTYKTPIRRFSDDPLQYRKRNHISEITVQQGSQRYVYGLPVYDIKRKDVTFTTNANQPASEMGMVGYDQKDASTDNDNKLDGFFQAETTEGYAHSFLLTAILSPDYADMTGNGITDDDQGTAIKFNYIRPFQRRSILGNSWANFKWRMPVESFQANFNRGLVTDNNDNKANYSYGEKELWYAQSIESKNMVAIFSLGGSRQDGRGVGGEDGGLAWGQNYGSQLYLDHIDLYSKADLKKYGQNAKPIKTVHFTYSYKLCTDYAANSSTVENNNGKLTLETIYFTYQKNTHQKNKYVFSYSNPEVPVKYNPTEIDRWGTYKPHGENPGGISNEDYPYSLQNKVNADKNASLWNLNKILLPSGARIDINYEADDYAYVQDKRAAQMTQIAGFGGSRTSVPDNKLYESQIHLPFDFSGDRDYIFFDLPAPIQTDAEVKERYFKDIKQLLLKLWVKVPTDQNGSGYEPIFVYCNILDIGLARTLPPGGGMEQINHNRFYVKLDRVNSAGSSSSRIMQTVYQFLRDQLPSKAFPGYDVHGFALVQVVRAVYGLLNGIRANAMGFQNTSRSNGWCQRVDLSRSVARLANPDLKKLGGGHRVKSVIITDNWKAMTNPGVNPEVITNSQYGQEYDYTTTEMVNNEMKVISSGVASYEPGVGNEENPFREILQYQGGNSLGPTELGSIELPLAETFFPSPSVGYSKVTVRSIHNKTNKKIKSGVGTQETHFYTTRDFPVISDFTAFTPASRHQTKPGSIDQIFNFSKKDNLLLTQGFRVVLNDMNGKIKMQASYAENDLENPINKTTYYYRTKKTGENKYRLDNIVPVITDASGDIKNKMIGKDIEVMNDFREHFSFTHSTQIPINADIFTAGGWPVVLPSVFRAIFRDESLYRSATTMKVVNEYGILERIENIDKGSITGTRNLVYDAETGEALITVTNNEFDKPLYTVNYPAYWANPGMGPAYKNIDATVEHVLMRNGKIEGGLTETEVNNIFESGDEIYVIHHSDIGPKDNAGCIALGSTPCIPLPISGEYRIWALDVTKDTRNTTKEMIFIDRNGVPFNASDATLRIIRSGRRNMTDASVGAITTISSPIKLDVNNNYEKVLIDENTKVINTSAVEFKEKWRVQDSKYYVRDIQVTENRLTRVQTTTIPTVYYTGGQPMSYEVASYRDGCGNCSYFEAFHDKPRYFTANRQSHGKKNKWSKRTNRSWFVLGLNSLPASATITNAILNLPAHTYGAITPMPHRYFYSNPQLNPNPKELTSHGVLNPQRRTPNANNDFVLERMQADWPSNDNGWRTQFNSWSPSNADRVIVPGPLSGAQLSSNTPVNNINITTMAQNMLRDMHDPNKEFTPALRLSMVSTADHDHETEVCFDLDRMGPMTVSYYDCSNPLPIGYVPQPGDQLASCVTTTTTKLCYSVFTRNYMNPYVQGLLGNWRPLRGYAFNGIREEQSPTTATTNIATAGVIKDYTSFWELNGPGKTLVKANPLNNNWVWTSQSTQFNRKGAEIETVDPLLRYNAAVYGYGEALPVATVSNSKLRLSAFDGFEDYFFKDQDCDLACEVNRRHFDTKINTVLLDETQAHTGMYSLRTAAQAATSIKVKISADNAGSEPDLYIHLNKTSVNVPWVVPKGVGINGTYSRSGTIVGTRLDPQINVNYPPNPLPFGMPNSGGNDIVWIGKIQVAESGVYKFRSTDANDYMGIRIIKPGVFNTVCYQNCPNSHMSCPLIINDVSLTAGELYDIQVQFTDRKSGGNNRGFGNLSWISSCTGQYQLVPKENLYPDAASANGSIIAPTSVCVKVDQIKAQGNFMTDDFNLIPGQKMISSVWVKRGGKDDDCHCSLYTGFSIKLKTAFNSNVATYQAKGKIIEGWQLFEAEFTVPNEAELEIYIDNSSSSEVALSVDDLRFHPFSANMKSFVYNPYNLKPSAELDENNYATFYEYDDDGTLIRVKKETVQGIKTLQESRSGLQKAVTGL